MKFNRILFSIAVLAVFFTLVPIASAEEAPLLRISYKEYPTPFYHVFETNKKICLVSETYHPPGPKDIDKKSGLEDLVESLLRIDGVDYVEVRPYKIMVHFSSAAEPWKFHGDLKKRVVDYFKGRGYRIRFFPAPE